MIPNAVVTAWGLTRPWPSRQQIEQDLLLARLIVDIYNHPYLGSELVFRGGTCLHQLRLRAPMRYSEDLDFVRRTHAGIGEVFDALRDIADRIGLGVVRRVTSGNPKMVFNARAEHDSSIPIRVKIEVNTYETSPAHSLENVPFEVDTTWFRGRALVQTYAAHELVATKIRALYQRRKGRDLFDLWVALSELQLDPGRIVAAFAPYRPEGFSGTVAEENLRAKLANTGFRRDLEPLLAVGTTAHYDIDAAGELVIRELLRRMDTGPTHEQRRTGTAQIRPR